MAERDDRVFLFVKISQKNEATAEGMDGFLKALHHVLPNKALLSLELTSREQYLRFYLVISRQYQDLIESQLYAQYPDSEIQETTDYLPETFSPTTAFAEVVFHKISTYPFKTYKEQKEDFLRVFTALLSKTDPGEEVFLQIILERVGSKIWDRSPSIALSELFGKRYTKEGEMTPSGGKLLDDLYRGRLRIAYQSDNLETSKKKLHNLINLFKEVQGENKLRRKRLNFFSQPELSFKIREVKGGDYWTTSEIATIYHFVPIKGASVTNVVHTTSRRAPAPDYLPREGTIDLKDVSFFGVTNYRNQNWKFGIKRIDRGRHLYIVGKTGVGKSKLLELLVISDVQQGHGCCFLDPHGDSADTILKYVPKERMEDVVYVNPLDKDFPVGFNPLEPVRDYEARHRLATFFIAIFKKQFGVTWNQRMEHLIRYITLALLETPDSSVLGIERMLTDTKFRQRVIKQIQDPVIKSFWTNEFSSWNERYANDAVVPIINKVGQFISNPVIRNMVGQIRNALDFESFVNEGKIVIINLQKGKLGEENIGLLGSMIITKIQQAALARSSMREEDRKDFYFYVDEFQNFATDAFSSILSEARKYHLNLTIAHQYIAQLPDDVKATAFGNVASIISFAVGGDDAAYLTKELLPVFSSEDLINLNAREMYIKMSIDGKVCPPFSGVTVDMPKVTKDYSYDILTLSRTKYGRNRVEVEREIERWTSTSESIVSETGEGSFPEPII